MSASWAQSTNQPQILFLHLRIKNQQVTLVETAIRPGVLKPVRTGMSDGLHYELLSATGESLWKAAIADPGVRVFEFEEPPGSGRLNRKAVPLVEADFTVRVPVVAQARRVTFYRMELPPPSAKSAQAPAKKSLGSVRLP